MCLCQPIDNNAFARRTCLAEKAKYQELISHKRVIDFLINLNLLGDILFNVLY